ncbi:RNA polymerase II mediator complex subunit [Spiromyces aspiralis]|uniref:RNA polymerase II mediator complex subunit n=1 Tax=Spiromyces aspiralis TaxID=68401 RepID=A0ACC1HEU9_9FUNG|nr:RNA polymerase II mediator complex subunit [Spiromyces aspiralis]
MQPDKPKSQSSGMNGNGIDSASSISAADSGLGNREEARARVENVIQDIVENLLEVGITAHDPQPNGETILQRRLEGLCENYQKLSDLKDTVDIRIPQDIIKQIYDDRNPENFTKDFTNRVTTEHQFVNAKMKSLMASEFKDELESELKDMFGSSEQDERIDYVHS